MKRVLITGATGFIGRQLSVRLSEEGIDLIASVRHFSNFLSDTILQVVVGDLSSETNWSNALDSVSTVIHTAARVHVMSDSANSLAKFRQVNLDGTMNLAKQAVAAGVDRFIFISSIKVHGESTRLYQSFTEMDTPEPVDPYGISKFETEQALYQLAKETGMEVVCIRPPLVYGARVKANFLSMMKWLYKGVPLPFGAIHNKRSLVALDNLVDFIITCVDHPAAANEVFLVADGEDLSTTELLNRVAGALGKKSRLLPVNQKVLEFCLKLIGKKDLAQRLCGSLQVDISKAERLLNWTPPVSVDEGLRRTAEGFKESHKSERQSKGGRESEVVSQNQKTKDKGSL